MRPGVWVQHPRMRQLRLCGLGPGRCGLGRVEAHHDTISSQSTILLQRNLRTRISHHLRFDNAIVIDPFPEPTICTYRLSFNPRPLTSRCPSLSPSTPTPPITLNRFHARPASAHATPTLRRTHQDPRCFLDHLSAFLLGLVFWVVFPNHGLSGHVRRIDRPLPLAPLGLVHGF